MRLELLGLKLAVVTNSIRETSEYMLRYSGILDFFQFIVTNEDVTNPKPSPEGYILACKKLGLDASEVVVIEDGDYGVLAAQAAGIQKIIRVNEPSEVSIDLLEKYIGDSYEY
jgi:HAD superfamily hydrolase (TIGR01509 family)